MKKNRRVRLVVFILSIAFLFQNVLLADPGIQTTRFNLHSLQVPTVFQSINKNALHTDLKCAIYEIFAARNWIMSPRDFRRRLLKTVHVEEFGDVEVEMDFSGRLHDRESGLILVDCVINAAGSMRYYKASINPADKEIKIEEVEAVRDLGIGVKNINFAPPTVPSIEKFDKTRPGRSFILGVNPGSTSTKIAIGQVIDGALRIYETEDIKVTYPSADLDLEQRSALMAETIIKYLSENNIPIQALAAVCGRGGIMLPNKGGLIRVNHRVGDKWVSDKKMLADLLNADLDHVSNMGAIISGIIAEKENIPAFVLDPVVTYNLSDEASLGGIRGFERRGLYHALNIHAVIRVLAGQLLGKSRNIKPEHLNIAACHIGGGISVAAAIYETGSGDIKAVDVNNALLGESPFSSERGIPQAGELIRWIYDRSDKPLGELLREFTKKAGLLSYTGTNRIEKLEELITEGRGIKSDLERRPGGNFEIDKSIIKDLTNASAERFEKLFPACVNDLTKKLSLRNIDISQDDLETLFKAEVADLALRGMALQIAKAMKGMTANFTEDGVDAFLLTGGGSKSGLLAGYITEYLGRDTPIYKYPGSLEQWAMIERTGAYLKGEIGSNDYEPQPPYQLPIFPKSAEQAKRAPETPKPAKGASPEKSYTEEDLRVLAPKGDVPFIENVSDIAKYTRTDGSAIITIGNPDKDSLRVLLYARKNNYIGGAILVGDKRKMLDLFKELPDIDEESIRAMNFRIEEMPRPKEMDSLAMEKYNTAISDRTVDLVSEGKAGIIIKGLVDSKIIIRSILTKAHGRYGFVSSIALVQLPPEIYNGRLIFVTDPGINTRTDDSNRQEIIEEIRNAVKTAQECGRKTVRVALITAVEKISAAISSTRLAREIADLPWPDNIKVSGPLSVDCALSMECAKGKGVNLEKDQVAGRADVLVFVGKDAINGANALYKILSGSTEPGMAVIVTGKETVPFVLISRTDHAITKINSILITLHSRKVERQGMITSESAAASAADGEFDVLDTVHLGDGYTEQILGPASARVMYERLSGDEKAKRLGDERNSEYIVAQKDGITVGLAVRSAHEQKLIGVGGNEKAAKEFGRALMGYLTKTALANTDRPYSYEDIPPDLLSVNPDDHPASRLNRTSNLTQNIAHIDGKCISCLRCVRICPDNSIMIRQSESAKPVIVGVNPDYCKGCGLCVNECPLHAISLTDKTPLLPARPFLFPVTAGKRIEVTQDLAAACKDPVEEKGRVIYEDDEIRQVEIETGPDSLLFTFAKSDDGATSMIAMRRKTVAIYISRESDRELAQKIRKAGYKVANIAGEGKTTDDVISEIVQNKDEIEILITGDPDKMSVELQRAFLNRLNMGVFYPGRKTYEPMLDIILDAFLPANVKDPAEFLTPGNRACQGCGEMIITNTVFRTLRMLGIRPINVDVASCHYVCLGLDITQPATKVPYIATNFAGGPAVASGIEASLKYLKKTGKLQPDDNNYVVTHLGDGAAYDIGLATLSGWIERGGRGLVIVHDNSMYGNTGGQRSSATPEGAMTTTTTDTSGKLEGRKDLVEIIAAHGKNAYVAYASISNLPDLEKKVKEAAAHKGPSVIIVYSSCPTGHGYDSSDSVKVAKAAVTTGEWLLYEVKNGVYGINYDIGEILNDAEKHKEALTGYYKMQKRYAHLFAKDGDLTAEGALFVERRAIQIREQFARLKYLAAMPAQQAQTHKAGVPVSEPRETVQAGEVKFNNNISKKNTATLGSYEIGIRWDGRGGQGAVTASDILADLTYWTMGLIPMAFPQFGPERAGAPVTAFNRASPAKIRNHSQLDKIDVSVILDVTLNIADCIMNLSEDGVIIVNTSMTPKEFRKKHSIIGRKIYTLDARRINKKFINLSMLGAVIKSFEHFGLTYEKTDLERALKSAIYRQFKTKPGVERIVQLNARMFESGMNETREEEAGLLWNNPGNRASETAGQIFDSAIEKEIVDGNEAVIEAVRQLNPAVFPLYPITPATKVGEGVAELVKSGEIDTVYIPADSEHSVANALLGAAQSGVFSMSATSSQGLIYMHEVLPYLSGMGSAVLLNVASRAIAAPINIHADHGDVMAVSDSGWIELFARNAQEVYDFNIIGRVLTERTRVPVMVIYDGFITSHTKEVICKLDDKTVDGFVGGYKADSSLVIDNFMRGSISMPDKFSEHKRDQAVKMGRAALVFDALCDDFARFSGRQYSSVQGYKLEDADIIIVSMASTAETAEIAVDNMRGQGVKAGSLCIFSYCPFPYDKIRGLLKGKNVVVTLDRVEEIGTLGPLYKEINICLDRDTISRDLICGRGGRDIKPRDLEKIFREGLLLQSSYLKNNADTMAVNAVLNDQKNPITGEIIRLIGEIVNAEVRDEGPGGIGTPVREIAQKKLHLLRNMRYAEFLGTKGYPDVREKYNTTEKSMRIIELLERERADRSALINGTDTAKGRHDATITKMLRQEEPPSREINTNTAQQPGAPRHYLRDISDEEALIGNLIEAAISILISGKKLTLVFDRNLQGLNNGRLSILLRKLDALKGRKDFAKYLSNLAIITTALDNLPDELKKREIDLIDADHNAVFVFTPGAADIRLSGPAMQTVAINEVEEFDARAYYYPLFEVVTFSLVKYVKGYASEDIYKILGDYNIDLKSLNIESIADGKNGEFLIFSLLPKSERIMITQNNEREARLLTAIDSSA
ncbi:MAG: phosphate acyltransferase [Candidatus Omnitrophica bacterium]|nr:phosphate acyltransferase [Candidatus Omnitrophota bacterium]